MNEFLAKEVIEEVKVLKKKVVDVLLSCEPKEYEAFINFLNQLNNYLLHGTYSGKPHNGQSTDSSLPNFIMPKNWYGRKVTAYRYFYSDPMEGTLIGWSERKSPYYVDSEDGTYPTTRIIFQ